MDSYSRPRSDAAFAAAANARQQGVALLVRTMREGRVSYINALEACAAARTTLRGCYETLHRIAVTASRSKRLIGEARELRAQNELRVRARG